MKKLAYFLFVVALLSCGEKQPKKQLLSQEKITEKTKDERLLAPTPPMGWNSWNWFGKNKINEDIVVKVIDSMVSTGLRDAGYEYVVIDGGWRDTKLGPDGELRVHPEKFPNGIKKLADYAHSKGLKFGLHTVPGTHDCIDDPVGGYGHEEVQIQQFVDWGVDLIKLDKCNLTGGWTDDKVKEVYTKWSNLLKAMSERPVLLSISAYQYYDWYASVGQMARSTEDISAKVAGMSGVEALFDGELPKEKNSWGLSSVMTIAEENNKWAKFAGNGYWNDPDMLVVGDHGLTLAEQKSHFALWCIMSAPLMLGNDPTHMTAEEKSILMNKTAIAIDQDPTEQGQRISKNGDTEIWAKKLAAGKRAVLLLNRNSSEKRTIALSISDLGLTGKIKAKEVYDGTNFWEIEGQDTFEIAPGSSLFLILTK